MLKNLGSGKQTHPDSGCIQAVCHLLTTTWYVACLLSRAPFSRLSASVAVMKDLHNPAQTRGTKTRGGCFSIWLQVVVGSAPVTAFATKKAGTPDKRENITDDVSRTISGCICLDNVEI